MADRTSLGFLGLMMGAITVAVMLAAATMVYAHVDGQMVLDGMSAVAAR